MALDYSTVVRRRGAARPKRIAVEICVLGGGIAGVSAAIEAARLGRDVALIDGAPQLGGQAVGSMVGTFCGLYGNGRDPRQVTHGIADEMLASLRASGDAHDIVGRRNTLIVQYRVPALMRWIEDAVRQAGVSLVLGAVLRPVQCEGRRVRALELATRYGDVAVEAGGFVDASGDAALAWNAGLGVREPGASTIYGTMMFTLDGVAEAALANLDRAVLLARLAEKAKDYGLRRHDGFVFQMPGSGETLINMTHIETPLDALEAPRAMLDGRAQIDRLVAFLRAEFPQAFEAARVRAYGLPGIRQTRWIVGRHHLTAGEVRAGVRFDDAIARCSWPIEFHDRPEGVVWEEFGDDHMHYVPFRSLTADECDNLVAAGRCIDADPVALSSVRVMGPCIAVGAAAAHALDLAGAGSVHQIDIATLKARLAHNLEN
ncbi:MAG TPA: FAD-dependent oxidoreductase [Alphaproteobacteria bacterium]|nr:FAD-dependent oxidoreductase [Alphaproteobacteria bacterium]